MIGEVYISLSAICLLSFFGTGFGLKCYSCYAKYGSREMTTYIHGPCWGGYFDGSQLDGISCRYDCITIRETTKVWDRDLSEWLETDSVFRGCSPYDKCKNIPRRPGQREKDKSPMNAECCNTTYCNGAVGGTVMNWFILVAITSVASLVGLL